MKNTLTVTKRTKVKRLKERASYDQEEIYKVVDKALCATVAFHDDNNTHAIPMAVWRENDHLYIHGSTGSRLMRCLQSGKQACVTLIHIDGLVLARSAPHHSINYRSVCIYGSFEAVAEENKMQHMQRFLEHWIPERWQYLRLPTKKELSATMILHMPIQEAVFKSRQGPPTDLAEDMEHPVWAGVVPINTQWGTPKQVVEQENLDLPGKFVSDLTL
jgi:nitroimidazol reductase NimA-like FMN-containing flavoprotein (pyridoxamine 5'-phosphate oxidase superfamily)